MSSMGLGVCTNAFLDELTALTRKHRVVIGGCGCCGSPFVTALKQDEEGYEYTINEYDNDLEFSPPFKEPTDPVEDMISELTDPH